MKSSKKILTYALTTISTILFGHVQAADVNEETTAAVLTPKKAERQDESRLLEVGSGLTEFVRPRTLLNGEWSYLVDPQDCGSQIKYYRDLPQDGRALREYDFNAAPKMTIPSDWNTADPQLLFYEGQVWFRRRFNWEQKPGKRVVLRFSAVSYLSSVWLDGQKLGTHEGGFSPFAFDVTDLLKSGEHSLVVSVDNTRRPENVPCAQFDWWNYGGIIRDVALFELPESYIAEGTLQCAKGDCGKLVGHLQLSGPKAGVEATVEIAALGVKATARTDAQGRAAFEVAAKPELWSPGSPKLYDVTFTADGDSFTDRIGFRTVETKGKQILVNGEPTFLKGICFHDEVPGGGRIHSEEQAMDLIRKAKELGCNYVRLAHYPHNEATVRACEREGLMIWSEIPVYWSIQWDNPTTYANAENQLREMIRRDRNRAAVVIWSLANETPFGEARDRFLSSLAKTARSMDDTRLISMAMLHTDLVDGVIPVKDSLGPWVDIVSFNAYLGWYWSSFDVIPTVRFNIPYDKPVIVSEFGGAAVYGLHGGRDVRWTEEFQAEVYRTNLEMLSKIDGLSGLSPWILNDFRSPRRPMAGAQDFYNRKGLLSEKLEKKMAFDLVREFYSKR